MRLLLSVFLLALVQAPVTGAKPVPVRIAVGEWPPYFSEAAEGYGTYAQVVTRAFELEGIEVQYGFFPWKRALLETQEGRWPVSAGWGRTADREPYFHFCDPVLIQREQFFYSTDRPVTAKTWQDLQGLSFGIIEGAALGEDLDRLVSEGSVTISRQATLEDLIQMLAVGRVDLVMGNENVARKAISTAVPPAEAAKYLALEAIEVQWDYRVIVSKRTENGAALCERFNKGLESLRRSGEYDRLLWPERTDITEKNGPS
ncbi:substrate-binding periplasmic protein [Roseibium sp. Sym1]|uniref:substrate-binding periplasmic protein n=1 Tax=Roseibium sp. Sym1 TaxID=3016006 RepID=UPI0022B4139F|nr:transporter substrate-binding domain-containing protein [Roseibium sp. Sym1]